MPSLMERLRQAFDPPPDPHRGEHDDIEFRLNQQKLAIARLNAYVKARRGAPPEEPGKPIR